jgi:hypothetical protein
VHDVEANHEAKSHTKRRIEDNRYAFACIKEGLVVQMTLVILGDQEALLVKHYICIVLLSIGVAG